MTFTPLVCALTLTFASLAAHAEGIQRWNRTQPKSGGTVLQPTPTQSPAPSVLSPQQPTAQPRRTLRPAPARRAAPSSSGSSVDLSVDLDSPNEAPTQQASTSSSGRPARGVKLAEPSFKIYFDFLLQRRPGINPLTFDNYHTLLLLEILPNADMSFSFEVSPSPRYYELNLNLTPKLMLRLGKIWVPFDQMNPHNMFGGWIYTSRFSQPNARSVFLPDLWTDLGIGFRYQLADTRALNVAADLYIVNGFQDGGSDPLGQVSVYPSFSTPSGVDNNGDKGIGGRFSAVLGGRFSLGASFYRDTYSDESFPNEALGRTSQNIMMIGADAGFRLPTTEIRAGYIAMNVTLPSPATSGFTRGAIYTEFVQRFGQKWRAFLRAGSAQNDNRVIDVTDKQVVGTSIQYDKVIYKIELQYFRDLNKIPVKVNSEFMAARFVVSL